ncbi:MAG: rhomboid family intramembrane serine protease [Planctomycetes bacterium]|nr:rhomboid family intramembrane serine protease [Planctomycetota bacterium]
MGIYDRDYYRKEGPSYLDSLIPSGQVCKWLIGINIALYVVQLATLPTPGPGGQRPGWGPVTEYLELDTANVLNGQVWRLLTYSFLHSPADWMHILFNLLFLWWFGSEIERMYGSREFLSFYLISAVIGGLFFEMQALVQGHQLFCLGASGAVTAVMVLFAFHFPHNLILVFFVLPVPIWLFVVFQVAQDGFHLLSRTDTPVAVSVHLGGAAFATLYYFQHWRILGFWSGMHSWRRQRSRPRLRVYRPQEEPVSVGAPKSADLDEHLDAKLDAVLEKLSRHGRDSLTDTEKEILQRASEIYKKKRT